MANYYVVTGSSAWGRAFQANADVVGGLVTGALNQFVSLPVSPSAGVPSDSSLYLSSSFAGYSGSIISAINRALALANEQGEVTWSEVSGALASADSVAYLPQTLELNGGAELKVGGAMSGSSTLAVGGILTAGADVLPAIDSLYDLGSSAKQWAQLHVDNLQADQLGAALDANSQAITNINVDSGNIDGVTIATSDITVGAGKTLNVSAGTLTLADDQISGDKISGGTIGTITISQLAGAMDVNSQAMTNVNIDSGNIDDTVIGASTAAAGNFTTVQAGTSVSTAALTATGLVTFAGGDLTVAADGTLSQAGSSTFTGGANFGVSTGPSAGSSTLFIAGDDASGTPKLYRLAVSGGILRAEQQ